MRAVTCASVLLSGWEVSPLCDREKDSNLPQNQIGFFQFVVLPFYTAFAHVLPASEAMGAAACRSNLEEWQKARLRASARRPSEA